jgi:hypothetical protein
MLRPFSWEPRPSDQAGTPHRRSCRAGDRAPPRAKGRNDVQDKYYSDKRDLVKWSVLLLLAQRYKLDRILQIAYFCHSDFGDIDVDGEQIKMPPEIRPFFRNFQNITKLCERPSISVLPDVFDDRAHYLKVIVDFISRFADERCAVFLDPDTGLEPARNPNLAHVLNSEAVCH